jgi:hypothetical protein
MASATLRARIGTHARRYRGAVTQNSYSLPIHRRQLALLSPLPNERGPTKTYSQVRSFFSQGIAGPVATYPETLNRSCRSSTTG